MINVHVGSDLPRRRHRRCCDCGDRRDAGCRRDGMGRGEYLNDAMGCGGHLKGGKMVKNKCVCGSAGVVVLGGIG